MKRKSVILVSVLILAMSFFSLDAFAGDNIISNDKFYAEIPENFAISNSYGTDNYYLTDEVNFSGNIEIYVDGNILFPDGIKDTDNETVKKRIKYYISKDSSNFCIKDAKKVKINGLTSCYIYGETDDGLFQSSLYLYVFTTKENLFIVSCTSEYAGENGPDYLTPFINSFLINGTYYNGEMLSKKYDFSKEERYIDGLERDVLTEEYFEYNSDLGNITVFLILLLLLLPVLTLILLVLLIISRKRLKEYKEMFGPIEQAKIMFRQSLQVGSHPYSANQQYYDCPNNPYNQSRENITQQSQCNNVPPELRDEQ